MSAGSDWTPVGILGLIITFFCLCAVFFLRYVWMRQRRYTREHFAFAALSTIGTLTLAFMVSLSGQVMPWNLLATLARVAVGDGFVLDSPTIADNLLLFTAYALAVWIIQNMFLRWDGLVSERLYKMEQRRESILLVPEGFREARRKLGGGEALPIHSSEVTGPHVQFEYGASVSWRERARDLVRLKWPHYLFEDDNWIERERRWVGLNTKTGARVVLHCAAETLDGSALEALLEDVRRIGDQFL